jgi:acyl-CoA dehydrogenase
MRSDVDPTTSAKEELQDIRDAIRAVCADFPDAYWRELDARRAYPTEFVAALTAGGWLGALIPERFGGSGLGLTEAAVILGEVNHSGGNAAAAHAQMYILSTILRHGSAEQQARYLPDLASGRLRLQAFGITEPDAGSDTTQIQTTAVLSGDTYVIRGQKIFISRVEHSDLMLLLARTAAPDDSDDRTRGLSLFLVDLPAAIASGQIVVRPLDVMMNHHTTQLFIDDLEVPVANVIGRPGEGFRYVIDSWNAERILIAAECVGDGDWFVERAARYASDRVVFGRAIGTNQGVQFPIADAYASVRAAELMTYRAAALFDAGKPCGPEANMAKYLASRASWAAANACLDTHGGYGFTAEYDVERKFRETRLYTIAPISNNLVLGYLGQHVLGMPKSY